MRCLKISGVIAFVLVLSAIPCAAQWQGNIPPGDYAQTCRNIQTDGNTLRAECQTRDGNWRRTSLDNLDRCGGGIINNDGRLQCGAGNAYPGRDPDRDNDNDRGYRGGHQGDVPPGDYAQTCRNIRANGNHLDAECQRKNGGWRRTSLDNIDQCGGGIINNNGRLQCGGGNGYGYPNRDRDNDNDRGNRSRWQGNLPPGDYTQTCRNITTNGNRLDAECQKRDGNWRQTSLDVDRCNSPIANDDGRLVCGR